MPPCCRWFFLGPEFRAEPSADLRGLLYGFAMGIGLGSETATKDALKVALIALSLMLFSLPVFWVAFRLLGHEEGMGHVAAIPLTLVSTVSIILAVTSPVVFMLSVMVSMSDEAIYIHIIIVNLAALIGFYLAGNLISHTFKETHRLAVPSVISFAMMVVILVVSLNFFIPFLSRYPTFSRGMDLLEDGLGIGVFDKANQSMTAAAEADRLSYHYQRTNQNGHSNSRLANHLKSLLSRHAPSEAPGADPPTA